jgi:hypothetical protein
VTFDLDMAQLGAFATAAAVGASFAGLALQAYLSRRFATLDRVAATEAALGRMTKRIEGVPAHEDFADMQRRMGLVEVAVGEVRSDIRGVRDGMNRVEHMVGLLVQNELKGVPDAG